MASLAGISADSFGQTIDQVRISGNLKTREELIYKLTGLQPGQILDRKNLLFARQELMDTGLFREIAFQTEREPDGGLGLHIQITERKYWLLLPRLSRNGDGDIKTGVRLRMYNINGADQTLDLLAQTEDEADGEEIDELRLSYILPMLSKPYKLQWQLNRKIEDRIQSGISNVEHVDLFSMAVSRDWHLDSVRIPLTVETAITFQERELDEPYPDTVEARKAGSFNSLTLKIIFDDIHEQRYRRFGSYYSLSITQGVEAFNSDYNSALWGMEMIRLQPINRYDNFNYRVVIGLAHESPFEYPYFGIGGATNIRGLESVDARGDSRWFANFEYILAYKKKPALRHTFFIDVGNVYDDLESTDLQDLRFSAGTGFRWKIESFVRTDLFVDYAYDFEEESGKVYGGTSLAF